VIRWCMPVLLLSSSAAVLAGCGETGTTGAGIEDELAAIPGVLGVEEVISDETTEDLPTRHFEFTFEQPADHDAPGGQTFRQRVALLHRDPDGPTVLKSSGYHLGYGESEPTALLVANQVSVEHRFFEPSRPDRADWHHLRIRQAAADHHRIVEALRPLYTGRWLSTGASKGGMTSVYHRRFYPDDVQGTIAYVAPQSYGDSDPRYIEFLENVGDAACRDALIAFQKQALSRRTEMIARMFAEDGASSYLHHTLDGALDYAVINLPFGFWQYQTASLCASIPQDTATDDEVWAFLDEVSPPSGLTDDSLLAYEPYYYQAAVELGYPAIDDSALEGLLTLPPGADVAAAHVAPGPTKEMTLDAGAMPDIADWLSNDADHMLFIYGETDPWSAAAFEPGGAKDTYRFFVPGGNHGVFISDLPEADRAQALVALATWAWVAPSPAPPAALAAERAERRSGGGGRLPPARAFPNE
jgi:hypothetical protein